MNNTIRMLPKRIMSFAVIIAAILSFSGCAKDVDIEKLQKKVIRWAVCSQQDAYELIAEEYMEQHPEVKIQVEYYPQKVFFDINRKMLSDGQGFDIFPINLGESRIYAASGHCVDLTDYYVSQIASKYKNPGIIYRGRSYDSRIISLPTSVQTTMLYYNKALFRELNIEIPRSWDDFIYASVKIKAKGILPIAIGMKDDWPLQYLMWDLLATKVQAKDMSWGLEKEKGRVHFSTTQGCIDSYIMYQELIANECISKEALYTSDEQAQALFADGESAMYFGGTWSFSDLESRNTSLIDIGAFPLPVNDEEELLAVPEEVGGDFAVWNGSDQKKESIDFLIFLLDGNNNSLLNAGGIDSPFKGIDGPTSEAIREFCGIAEGALVVPFVITQQNWPDGKPCPIPMVDNMKACFLRKSMLTAKEFWIAMDNAWREAYENGKQYK